MLEDGAGAMDFARKVVLITGAAAGIGKAAAEAFARARAEAVVLVDRDEEHGEALARDLRDGGSKALFVPADVASAEDMQRAVQLTIEQFGRIDCLFNNAGIEGTLAPSWSYDPVVFERVMAVNVTGVFMGMRMVLPHMRRQGAGAIVNSASVGGLVAAPGMCAYVAAKHAVLGLTKCAAVEAGPDGVRVNAICPGTVETDMIRRIDAMRWPGGSEELQRFYGLMTPTRRASSPEEVADLVLFLASSRSGNINGASIVADGGRHAGLSPWIEAGTV